MSVVACFGLFSGVLLAADCRVTWVSDDGSTSYSDDAQKIFHVAPGTAIAFVGDVRAAARLLRAMASQLSSRKHTNPESLSHWIPRLFRREYSLYATRCGREPSVAFIVAFVLRCRPNVLRSADVKLLFDRTIRSNRGWISDSFLRIFQASLGNKYVGLTEEPYSTFYTMRSPHFAPIFAPPLTYRAIGSGEGVVEEVGRYSDLIMMQPGNAFIETMNFRMALHGFAQSSGVTSVGGLYPMLKVRANRTDHIGMKTQISIGTPDQTDIELQFDGTRWIQRNLTSGREVPLKLPWELLKGGQSGQRFDDFDKAWSGFQGD